MKIKPLPPTVYKPAAASFPSKSILVYRKLATTIQIAIPVQGVSRAHVPGRLALAEPGAAKGLRY